MDNETVFLDGFTFERPKEGSPSFVKGKMGINVEKAIAFLEANKNEKGWVNADLLTSKDGQKLYWKVNNWKPEAKKEAEYPDGGIDPASVPF